MRRIWKKAAPVLAVGAIAVSLVLGGLWFFRENYLMAGGRLLWRHARSVELAGHEPDQLEFLQEFTRLKTIDARGCPLTPEQYTWLRREFPQCRVEWEVPFQGRRCSSQTQKLTVTSLSDEDVLLLDHFPGLKSVDGWDCRDYAQLVALQKRRPECKVFYAVPIGGQLYDCDMGELRLENADLGELEEKLGYLPNVHTLHLMGTLPDMEQLQKLLKKYPTVALSWQVDVADSVLELGSAYLDLSGFAGADVPLIENLIPYLPALERVDLTGCGLSMEELVALVEKYPRITFLFDVTVGPVTVSSDVRELDLSGHYLGDVSALEPALPCFGKLEKVILCGCGIPSEELDALGKRFPHIRFVWSVKLGGLEVRTDARYFIPTKYDVDVSDRDLEELRYCVDMEGVDVGHMKGVTHCRWAAHMPKLKYLVLADTNVSDISPLAGLEELVFLELFLTRVRDLTPLLSCPALEDLNLCYTYADPEPATRITWLKRLWWAGNWNAKVRYGDAFRENLTECSFVFDTESSTGKGWRTGKNYYAMRDLFGMNYMSW